MSWTLGLNILGFMEVIFSRLQCYLSNKRTSLVLGSQLISKVLRVCNFSIVQNGFGYDTFGSSADSHTFHTSNVWSGGIIYSFTRSEFWLNSLPLVVLFTRPMGRPRRRWEDNIKMDLQEVGGGCWDWMELAQDRDRWRALVNTVMKLRVAKMRGISWLPAEPVSFSRRTLLHGVSK